MFGDAIVVWRAWAVWTERRIVIILPAFFLFATFAIFLTSSSLRTIASVNPSIVDPDSLFGSLLIAGYTASIATNFTSTVLIGIKAYKHRRFMKMVGFGNSVAVKIMIFLTECGVTYIIFQVRSQPAFLNVRNYMDLVALNIASHVWGVLMNFIAAMYPTLIILIVHRSRSISDVTGLSGSPETPVFSQTHLTFARSPTTNNTTIGGTDLESGSRWNGDGALEMEKGNGAG
ncbi:hypothetical protein BT96DRAFT_306913 [Gymnopus androsaceus JB14]|uniref:Uncharacterized protein n=1 Tax=Gymnopus androsaceus JB14 TaxID=1447944 RepID=A0A6A4I256_9AGAR|nr:hypothetical protein BT96DRAFT_306913 [Gymnopus androsaceus JB14]